MTKLPGSRPKHERKPLGQVAYECYVNRTPAVLPPWGELNGIERNVWSQVAKASIEASKKAAMSRVR